MSSPKIPITITYKKAGTTPPLYLAGSFSDPEWHPTEMTYTTDEDGEHTFQSEVLVEAGQEYQFKLRVGSGDWWVLSEEHETVTDDSGNKNNVLKAPSSSLTQHEKSATGDSSIQDEPKPPMPSVEVQVPKVEENRDEVDDLKTPLFAHECLGAYSFADDESEEEACPSIPMRRYMESKPTDYDKTDIDVNDPTLEKFPSDRTSIMDALRTIQTHLGEDQTHLKDIPPSPRVVSSGRPSIDSTDEMSLSPAPLSPNTTRRREQRLSHSSFRRSRSAVSLGSIAEEDSKAEEAAQEDLSPGQLSPNTKTAKAHPVITRHSPNTASAAEPRRSPPSEEDEAVAMRSSKVTSNGKDGKTAPAYSASDDFVPDQSSQDSEIAVENASEMVTERDLQPVVHQVKAPSEPRKPIETGSNDSDTSQLANVKSSSQAASSERYKRPAASNEPATVGDLVHGLLTGARRNKLPVTMAASIVVVAVVIRWWNGSGK